MWAYLSERDGKCSRVWTGSVFTSRSGWTTGSKDHQNLRKIVQFFINFLIFFENLCKVLRFFSKLRDFSEFLWFLRRLEYFSHNFCAYSLHHRVSISLFCIVLLCKLGSGSCGSVRFCPPYYPSQLKNNRFHLCVKINT